MLKDIIEKIENILVTSYQKEEIYILCSEVLPELKKEAELQEEIIKNFAKSIFCMSAKWNYNCKECLYKKTVCRHYKDIQYLKKNNQ
jgi:hypothetical protein